MANTSGLKKPTKKTVMRNGKPYPYYLLRITVGTDPGTGKQIQKDFTGKTAKEVKEKASLFLAEHPDGTCKAPVKMTVGQWLDTWSEEWLNGLKPRTVEAYKKNIWNYIKPALGAKKLTQLTVDDVQKFVNRLGKEGYTVIKTVNGKKIAVQKELSAKSIKNIHGTLHSALNKAVDVGHIKVNPADRTELPRIEKKQIKPLEEKELKDFLTAIKGHRFETVYAVTAFTGLRQAEVLGLSWDCIDFERGTILVKQQLQKYEGTNGKYVLNPTKNGKWRTIVPAAYVMTLLKHRRAEQIQDRFKAVDAWENPMNLVFTDELGKCFSKNTVYKNYKKIVAAIGIPEARFHDLRHTYAVTSIRSGDDIKTVQGNLGHATASFTLDVYGHVTEQMKRDSSERMESYIASLNMA